jgi:hypothetical protein
MGAEVSNPQDVEQGRAADRAPLRLTSRENDKAVLSLAAREAVGKASRSEIAPQRLEKIESRRESCSMSGASDLQDVVHGRAAHRARLRLMGRRMTKLFGTRSASRPGNGAQRLEKIESRRGDCSMSGASDPQDMVHGRAADRARLRLMGRRMPKLFGTRGAGRPGNGAQCLEKIESRRGNCSMSEASNPQDMVHGRAAGRARLRLTSRENGNVAKLGIFWSTYLKQHKKQPMERPATRLTGRRSRAGSAANARMSIRASD